MSFNIDLDQLKNFVAVGEELHFTRAAEKRLHLSQPWLSRSVRNLEGKLGVRLFHRHSRHVELTEPGQRLLYGARKLIHDFDSTIERVLRDRKGNGQLTVGYSPYVDLRFLTELKETSLPGTRPPLIRFESSSSDETALRVRRREWDCGVVILPVDPSDLEVIPLFRLPLAAALARTHRLARKRSLRFADLMGERLIIDGKNLDGKEPDGKNLGGKDLGGKELDGKQLGGQPLTGQPLGVKKSPLRFREWLLARLAEAGVTPKAVQDASSPHEALYLVTRGAGIALANSGAFRTRLDAIVVRTLPSEPVETALVLRKGKRSPGVEAFAHTVLQLASRRIGRRLGIQSAA